MWQNTQVCYDTKVFSVVSTVEDIAVLCDEVHNLYALAQYWLHFA